MSHSWGMGSGLCLPLTLQDPACHDSDMTIRVTQNHWLMVILHGQSLCGHGDYLLPWGHLEIPLLVIKKGPGGVSYLPSGFTDEKAKVPGS